MADTLANITLPSDTWVNLYAASGISVGTQIQTQNVGQTRVRLHTGATAPTSSGGFNIIPPDSEPLVNQATSAGEWAFSETSNGLVNVGQAT